MTPTGNSTTTTRYRIDPARVVVTGGRWGKASNSQQCSCCLEYVQPRGWHYRADRWTVLCRACFEVARRAS